MFHNLFEYTCHAEASVINNSLIRRNLISRQSGEHCHKYSQILLGWKGLMECEFQRGSGKIDNGTIALVPSSAEHVFSGLSDDSELLVIDLAPADPYIQALEQACNTSFEDTLFQQAEFICLTPETKPLLDFAAKQLLFGENKIKPQVNCQLVSLFLTQLCQMYSDQSLQLIYHRLDANRLNQFIDQETSSSPDNSAIANAMCISESHLYSLCQKEFGLTPQQYVMARRMQRAHFLLTNSQMPLTEIALELGFSQTSSFSRAYKNHYRVTPSSVRRKLSTH